MALSSMAAWGASGVAAWDFRLWQPEGFGRCGSEFSAMEAGAAAGGGGLSAMARGRGDLCTMTALGLRA
jgi:hypothetical protein